MADNVKIEVQGLREFRAGLKHFAPEVLRNLALSYTAIADMVKTQATEKAMGEGGVEAHAVKTGALTAVASTTGVAIRLDASKSPAAFGAEFGGGRFRAGNPTPAGGYTSQFKPHRGRTGYFLYPTIRDLQEPIETAFLDAVEHAARQAFPD